MRSKNSLKRPLYEALKIGVTAMTPSAPRTASRAAWSVGAGKPGQHVVRQILGEVAQLDDLDLRLDPGLAEVSLDRGRKPVAPAGGSTMAC